MLKKLILTAGLIVGLGAAGAIAKPLPVNTTNHLPRSMMNTPEIEQVHQVGRQGLIESREVWDRKNGDHKKKYRKYDKPKHGDRVMRRYNGRQIATFLYHRGYRNVSIVEVNKRQVVAHAYGRRGPVRLLVSRRTGEVIAREHLGFPRHGYQTYRDHRGPSGSPGYSFSFGFGF